MARPLRIEYPNAYYHVTNRGEEGVSVFPGPKYFQAFLDCIAEAGKRFNVDIICYCLLRNEYNLVIKTPEGNLSRFMRQVDGLYTQHYQKLKKESGSVFKSRYKSVLLQPEKYLLAVSRYIHNLPKKNKTRPESYTWSSLTAYTNKVKAPAWLKREEVISLMTPGARPNARYGAYVAQGVDAELAHFYGKKNLLSILGDERFKKRAQGKLVPGTARGKSKGPQARLRPSIKKVVTAVATHFKVTKKSIYQAARGPGSRNLPRWTAMYLCQEVAGVTLQDISLRFGLKRYGTVSTTIGKLKQEFIDSPKSFAAVKKLRAQLSP
ncbi:MAG: helix-turn-helix domain-containing protein [Gammaproteobacteria bacterium]|nr:helix-turn-helix domain-containing protein [Gammaproteobacteria bacterium]